MEKPCAYIYTLGCRVNTCESLALADALADLGFEVMTKKSATVIPDAVIVNTCAVTKESSRKSAKAVRSLAREFPNALILAAGCLTQLSPEAVPEAHVVVGNCDKNLLAPLAKKYVFSHPEKQIVLVGDIKDETRCSDASYRTHYKSKCHIKIEDGCDSRCAYCIIPSLRGRVRSKDPEALLSEIRSRIAEGCSEILLTGIETGSYGKDLKNVCLADILEKVDGEKGLYLLRLGSMDPFCFNDGFIERLSKIRHLEKHIHFSVQSGCSETLARMRRKYNAETLLERIEKVKAAIPGIALTADVITGFPGETEEEFQKTCEFAKKACFLHMHIFPYSEREGTEAAKMAGSVPMEIRKERAARLDAINNECKLINLRSAVGSEQTVHFETAKGGVNKGYTPAFMPVKLNCGENLKDKIFTVRITGVDEKELCLTAELVKEAAI